MKYIYITHSNLPKTALITSETTLESPWAFWNLLLCPTETSWNDLETPIKRQKFPGPLENYLNPPAMLLKPSWNQPKPHDFFCNRSWTWNAPEILLNPPKVSWNASVKPLWNLLIRPWHSFWLFFWKRSFQASEREAYELLKLKLLRFCKRRFQASENEAFKLLKEKLPSYWQISFQASETKVCKYQDSFQREASKLLREKLSNF